MNPSEIILAVCAVASIVVQLIVFAYVYGRLTQQTKANADRINDHDTKIESHDERLGGHDVEIGQLKAWRDGYNAGAAKTIHTH